MRKNLNILLKKNNLLKTIVSCGLAVTFFSTVTLAASNNSNYYREALSKALGQVRLGQHEKAVPVLLTLSRKTELASEKAQIKYILGISLLELKLYQVAAFQFVEVIRMGDSKYTRPSIEKLTLVADALGDDSLLNYAITKVELDKFPPQYKDLINFRLGEIKQKNGNFEEAADLFSRVTTRSRNYFQAQFNRGLCYLETKQTDKALSIFQSLLDTRNEAKITDINKVASQLAIARTHYQAQNWEASIEAYRAIPKDSIMWHDALFEMTWAYLRAAKFRTALSNFQSLHSSFYEDSYLPESLLLRSILYLYICRYDEMDKVLELFQKTYGPVRSKVGQFILAYGKENLPFYNEIEMAQVIRRGEKTKQVAKIPYSVTRHILDEGDVKRSLSYIDRLRSEKKLLLKLRNLPKTGFGSYALKVIDNRIRNTKLAIGEMVRSHLYDVRAELKDLYQQTEFARAQMLEEQKNAQIKKIAGKNLNTQIDDDKNREYYIQNGLEYWPFDGEYWLDEIGNYHYLGKQNCE